jgi:hypothetical protein
MDVFKSDKLELFSGQMSKVVYGHANWHRFVYFCVAASASNIRQEFRTTLNRQMIKFSLKTKVSIQKVM